MREGDQFTQGLCVELIAEEYDKLLSASNRDVHDDSKTTTLPIAREIVEAYIAQPTKLPWYIDLLNITLDVQKLGAARERIKRYVDTFAANGTRVTDNPDFQ